MITVTIQPNRRIVTRFVQRAPRQRPSSDIPWIVTPVEVAPPPILDIDCEFQDGLTPHKELRPGWGLMPRVTKFGRRATDRLFQGAGALDQLGLSDRAALVTFTLPGSTEESFSGLARYSGYAVNRLRQFCRDLSYEFGCEHYWFSVWEYQKRGALHLHAVIASENEQFMNRVSEECKALWIRILQYISEKIGHDMFSDGRGSSWINSPEYIQVDCRRTYTGIAGYLAKYVTKSGFIEQSAAAERFPPSRFWSMSRNLLSKIRDFTDSFSIELSENQEMDILSDIQAVMTDFGTTVKAVTSEFQHRLSLFAQFAHDVTHDVVRAAFDTVKWFAVPLCNLESRMQSNYNGQLNLNRLYVRAHNKHPHEVAALCKIAGIPHRINHDKTVKILASGPILRDFQCLALIYMGYLDYPCKDFSEAVDDFKAGKIWEYFSQIEMPDFLINYGTDSVPIKG